MQSSAPTIDWDVVLANINARLERLEAAEVTKVPTATLASEEVLRRDSELYRAMELRRDPRKHKCCVEECPNVTIYVHCLQHRPKCLRNGCKKNG